LPDAKPRHSAAGHSHQIFIARRMREIWMSKAGASSISAGGIAVLNTGTATQP
jgi:hypothetical protein